MQKDFCGRCRCLLDALELPRNRACPAPVRPGNVAWPCRASSRSACGSAALFASLVDLTVPYRITATFSSMHTGGSEIETYLVTAIPFVWLAFGREWPAAVRLAGLDSVGAGRVPDDADHCARAAFSHSAWPLAVLLLSAWRTAPSKATGKSRAIDRRHWRPGRRLRRWRWAERRLSAEEARQCGRGLVGAREPLAEALAIRDQDIGTTTVRHGSRPFP